jgi:hypothetical protein
MICSPGEVTPRGPNLQNRLKLVEVVARSLLAVGANATGEVERGGGSVLWARLLPSS